MRRSGEFFGEIALVQDLPRTATVKATTPLRFFVLTRQSFLRLLDANPRVERKMLSALAKKRGPCRPISAPNDRLGSLLI